MRAIDLDQPSLSRIIHAVRGWGDTTHVSYSKKVAELLALRPYCAQFTEPVTWLYRGQGTTMTGMTKLKLGASIPLDKDKRLMLSWTKDFRVAQDFADATLMSEPLLIEKQGLVPFFDYEVFGRYLTSIGYDYHDDQSLTDPIREKEVIVYTTEPMRIDRDDVNEAYL